jgi:hypothetical protein
LDTGKRPAGPAAWAAVGSTKACGRAHRPQLDRGGSLGHLEASAPGGRSAFCPLASNGPGVSRGLGRGRPGCRRIAQEHRTAPLGRRWAAAPKGTAGGVDARVAASTRGCSVMRAGTRGVSPRRCAWVPAPRHSKAAHGRGCCWVRPASGRPRIPVLPGVVSRSDMASLVGHQCLETREAGHVPEAGKAPLSPNATPASITAWRTRNNPAMPGESTDVKALASTASSTGRLPSASMTQERNRSAPVAQQRVSPCKRLANTSGPMGDAGPRR